MADPKLIEFTKLIVPESELERYVYLIQNKDLSFSIRTVFSDKEISIDSISNTSRLRRIYKKGSIYCMWSNFEGKYTIVGYCNSFDYLFELMGTSLRIKEIYDKFCSLSSH